MNAMRTAAFPIAVIATLFCARVGHSADRRVPEIPASGEKLRVIIDTDAACEIDDLYAIALAVLCRDRFEIEGFVAAHFGDAGGPEGIDRSYRSPTKGFFDLGDVAALVDPSLVYWEVVDAPSVNWDMLYDHRKTHGKIVRIYQIDSDQTFALLHQRLADAFPKR